MLAAAQLILRTGSEPLTKPIGTYKQSSAHARSSAASARERTHRQLQPFPAMWIVMPRDVLCPAWYARRVRFFMQRWTICSLRWHFCNTSSRDHWQVPDSLSGVFALRDLLIELCWFQLSVQCLVMRSIRCTCVKALLLLCSSQYSVV